MSRTSFVRCRTGSLGQPGIDQPENHHEPVLVTREPSSTASWVAGGIRRAGGGPTGWPGNLLPSVLPPAPRSVPALRPRVGPPAGPASPPVLLPTRPGPRPTGVVVLP